MHPVIFQYKIFDRIPCPIVDIGIRGVGVWRKIDAYVDSGASLSIFSSVDADRLGLKMKDGRKRFAGGIGGKSIPIYVYRLMVQFGPQKFYANIGFTDELGVGFNLLGREDFFSHFDITFSDVNRRLTFQPIKGKSKSGGKNILTAAKRRRKAY